MGCYVNPSKEPKETWLARNGELVKMWSPGDLMKWAKDYDDYCQEEKLPVVMVDNGLFRAAAVTYNRKEFEDFMDVRDPRARMLYLVKIEDLKTVSDLENYRPDLKSPVKVTETSKVEGKAKNSVWDKIKNKFHKSR